MNEYVKDEYENLSPGMAVQDSRGQDMGVIGDTVGGFVELRGADQVSSYWIRRSEFGEANHEAVLLGFPSDEIESRAAAQPPATREDSVETGVLADPEDEQRETMMEELAEQRDEMRESGRATEEAYHTVGEPVEQELEEREAD